MNEGSPTKDSYLDFPMPEGLTLPEGTEEGAQVDLLATFQLKGEKLCLKAVEGIPVAGQEEAEPAPDEEVGYADAVEQGL